MADERDIAFVRPAPSEEQIDAVYTWVDSSDQNWHEQFQSTLKAKNQNSEAFEAQPYRFRNHDELRFSLRSLETYCPWVRRIFLVTANQIPSWFDGTSHRISIVNHADIFPDHACLPTFNSHAIELCLHRIPGLSKRFLYFNDDLFLGQRIERSEYKTDESYSFYFEPTRLSRDLDLTSVTDCACNATLDLVHRALGGTKLSWMPAHVPQIYDATMIAELEHTFRESVEQTRKQRFRSPNDFVLRIAYATLATQRGHVEKRLRWGSSDYAFVRMHGSFLKRLRDLIFVARRRPKFFCINDDFQPGPKAWALSCILRILLSRVFPQASTYEKSSIQ